MRARGEVTDAEWAIVEPLLRFPQPDAGWRTVALLQSPLGRGAAVRLAAKVPKIGHALQIPCRKLPRYGPARLHEDHAEVRMMGIYRTSSSHFRS